MSKKLTLLDKLHNLEFYATAIQLDYGLSISTLKSYARDIRKFLKKHEESGDKK